MEDLRTILHNLNQGNIGTHEAEYLIADIIKDHNSTWASMRHEACLVREIIAIEWMLKIWCDVEVTPELVEQVVDEFRRKNQIK